MGTTPEELSIEDKRQVLEVITTLRNYQLIGIIEARNWIEKLFPEFGEFRDHDADAMFGELASLTAGKERSDPGNRR